MVRDLGSRTLPPGFFDSHNHALSTGHNLPKVDLSEARSLADVLGALAARVLGPEWSVSVGELRLLGEWDWVDHQSGRPAVL